jgi:hypothetical protein
MSLAANPKTDFHGRCHDHAQSWIFVETSTERDIADFDHHHHKKYFEVSFSMLLLPNKFAKS